MFKDNHQISIYYNEEKKSLSLSSKNNFIRLICNNDFVLILFLSINKTQIQNVIFPLKRKMIVKCVFR